jgi:RNA-binding protein
MELNGKQRRALRALGHHLQPVVMLGKEGVSAAVVCATAQALDDHELIKIKVGEASPLDRHEASEALSRATQSEVAQVLGRTLLLFRRHPERPRIALPGLPLPKLENAPPAPPARKARPKHKFRGSRQRD